MVRGIASNFTVFHNISIRKNDMDAFDSPDGDSRENEIMLVDIIKFSDRPKVTLSIGAWPYFIANEIRNIRRRFSDRQICLRAFKVFPFDTEGKGDAPISCDARDFTNKSHGPVIQRRSK